MSTDKFFAQLIIVISVSTILTGCLITIKQDRRAYTPKGKLPTNKEIPFESKEALSRATVLNMEKAAKIYYTGTEPLSYDADVVMKLAYRFASTLGMNTDFDPNDPEAINKVLTGATDAAAKLREENHRLKEDVNRALEEKMKIERDKVAEVKAAEAEGARWKLSAKNLWFWLWVTVFGLIALTFFFPTVGGYIWKKLASGVFSGLKNVGQGVQAGRERLQEMINQTSDEKEREALKKALAVQEHYLDHHQTEDDKNLLKKWKKKGKIKTNGDNSH